MCVYVLNVSTNVYFCAVFVGCAHICVTKISHPEISFLILDFLFQIQFQIPATFHWTPLDLVCLCVCVCA